MSSGGGEMRRVACKTYLPLLVALLVSGCQPGEGVYRNLYDGLQKREQMVNRADEPMARDGSSYDQYTRERDEILSQENP